MPGFGLIGDCPAGVPQLFHDYTALCNSHLMVDAVAAGQVPVACGVAGSVTAGAGKPALATRPLITPGQAGALVGLFKVLGSESRLRLVHALHRGGQVPVGELAEQVGMRPQAVSNQLQRLADRGMVSARRDGNRIFYSIADPCLPGVLDLALCLIEEAGR